MKALGILLHGMWPVALLSPSVSSFYCFLFMAFQLERIECGRLQYGTYRLCFKVDASAKNSCDNGHCYFCK